MGIPNFIELKHSNLRYLSPIIMRKLQLLIQKILLQIQILQIQLAIKLLRQKLTVPNLDDPIKIILHHGGGWANLIGVNFYHKKMWGFKSSLGYYVGYTIFIDRQGKATQTRRDNETGAHTKGYNRRTIGIGLMGNGVEKDFTEAQYRTLETILESKCRKYNIEKREIYGHRDFSPNICPSDRLYSWMLKYKGRI